MSIPFDPRAPLIGPDGLEYANLAARIKGEPFDSWRNQRIRSLRELGAPDDKIRAWYRAYDGDGTLCTENTAGRHVRANFAIHKLGLPIF